MEPPGENSPTRHGIPYQDAESSPGLRAKYACRWAVIIGIDSYQHLQPLKYAVADARGMAKLLTEEYDFQDDHVFPLENEQATREAIRQILIDRLPSETQFDDCILIFFAGHGAKRKLPGGAEKGYLAPVDAHLSQWTTYLAISELLDAANMTAAKHIFYIVDSCYSGFATTRTQNFQSNRFERDLLTNRARLVLTAGLDDQVVDDLGPSGHSIFTYHVIQGLKGFAATNSDGAVTATQLIAYVRENVGNNLSSRQTPDYGFLIGHESGGDFVFMRKAKSDSAGLLTLTAALFDPKESQIKQELQEVQEFLRNQQNADDLRRLLLAVARGQIDPGRLIPGTKELSERKVWIETPK
jgi:Caspase domain